jgi:hypothetical protein
MWPACRYESSLLFVLSAFVLSRQAGISDEGIVLTKLLKPSVSQRASKGGEARACMAWKLHSGTGCDCRDASSLTAVM